ncbi:MAG: SBBP repeat-containing protein [Phormidesmis sp.]
MEENFSVSLLTPASDLVGGSTTAEFEFIFARAGNDVLFPFDPTAVYPETNIDVMFGDLFDNSPEEFAVTLGIIEGSPLGILESDIPSLGRDRYILGDESGAFYTDPNPFNLLGSNPLGANEFAIIYDFGPGQDIIQLSGDKKDYSLIEVNDLDVEGVSQPFSGEAIFYNGEDGEGIPDLVGFIVSTDEQDYELDDKDVFDFVGDKGKDKGDKDIVRLGTEGFDLSQNTTIDSFGNIYVVGSTNGSLGGVNKGAGDIFVAKYNNNGRLRWKKQHGSARSEDAFEIVTDESGGVNISGNTSGSLFGPTQAETTDAWVAKLSASNGSLVWGKQFNAGASFGPPTFSNSAFGLDVNDGKVYVSGLAIHDNTAINPATGAPFNASPFNGFNPFLDFTVEDDSWLAVFDADTANLEEPIVQITGVIDPDNPDNQEALANGNFFPEFIRELTPFFDESYDMAVDAEGNAYLVGWTQGLVKESDPGRDLLKYDAWISKVNTNNEVEWVTQFGNVNGGLDFGWAVDTDSQGNVIVSGWTTGNLGTNGNLNLPSPDSYDVFVSKFAASNGEQLATKILGTDTDDGQYYSDLTIDSSDNVYLTGYTNNKKFGNGGSTKGDDSDAFVAKLDANLNEEWITQIGTKEKTDYATGVAVDNAGNVIVTGVTEGAIGNGPGKTIDGWVARLDDEKGKLDKFVGKDKDGLDAISGAASISVTDGGRTFASNSDLPDGDNILTTGLGVLDYGDLGASLTEIFDPKLEGSFTDELVKRLQDGNTASNVITGSDKKDDMKGEDGNDVMYGMAGDDKLKGEDGNDVMYGMAGDDKLEGKDGNDALYGGTGDDELKGGKGADILSGVGDGLLGGGEFDELKGEDGSDLFVLGSSNGVFYQGNGNSDYALIKDFDVDEGDRIRLSGSAGSYSLGTNVSGLKKGTAIFHQGDLVGVVEKAEDIELSDRSIFEFV